MVLSEVDGTGILGLQLRLFDLKTCCSSQPWKKTFQTVGDTKPRITWTTQIFCINRKNRHKHLKPTDTNFQYTKY